MQMENDGWQGQEEVSRMAYVPTEDARVKAVPKWKPSQHHWWLGGNASINAAITVQVHT